MRWQGKLAVMSVAVIAGLANQPLRAQGVGKYFAPKDQVVAIRAGRLFDSRSGNILNNQVVGSPVIALPISAPPLSCLPVRGCLISVRRPCSPG